MRGLGGGLGDRGGGEGVLGGGGDAAHVPFTHSALLQSHLDPQAEPGLHAELHPPPPQSTPVSLASLIPLRQVAA